MELSEQPRLYTDLAEWWPLFSPPSHYDEEAADLLATLLSATDPPARTMLELGSGGGSLASHFKHHHRCGIFPRATWIDWVSSAGFTPSSRLDPWKRDVFVGQHKGCAHAGL
jgi:hypothetical protein